MALRIAPILLAVICSLCLYAADDGANTEDSLAGHPSETVLQTNTASADAVIGKHSPSTCITYGECPECRTIGVQTMHLRERLSDKVDSVFGDTKREFPFSPRLIRQYNYDIEIPDASLYSGEFLIQNNVLPQSNATPTLNFSGAIPNSALHRLTVPEGAVSRGFIVQTAGADSEASFELVLDADGHGISIIRRGNDDEPVLVECDDHVGCLQYMVTNPDEEPIDVVLADCDDACETPAAAAAPQPTTGLRQDAAIQLTPLESYLRDDAEGLMLLAPAWQFADADNTTRNPASKADDDCGSPSSLPPTVTAAAAAALPMPASESCSHAEPPLKAKVEHLLEAARHLAGAGYEEEAKLFRVEAEAIQNASTRLLTEKRQELEQLQREITELEALTGQYQMIQIDCRIIEMSLPADCDAGAQLSMLQEPGVHVLTGRPCSADVETASRLLSGEELAHALQAIEQHPCGVLRTIAEPVMQTMNGRPARLHSGGEFPTLVPVSATARDGQKRTAAAIDWTEFGVTMQAVPFVLGNGKVRLSLETEVSDRDFSNAVDLNGMSVPGLTTRRFRSDIEAQFGETVAIACNSTQPQDGDRCSLLVLVTARQIEPPAERPDQD